MGAHRPREGNQKRGELAPRDTRDVESGPRRLFLRPAQREAAPGGTARGDRNCPSKVADRCEQAKRRRHCRRFFDVPTGEFRLEIGFGGGEHLLHAGRSNAGVGFIGVEPFENGLAKAVTAISREGMKNVRLYNQDAALLLDWLPAKSIARIDLLFPDPWPKKRHWKRRFVSQANLDRFARVPRD